MESNSGFLLTRPLRDVTEIIRMADAAGIISTHTPLAGRDEFQDINITIYNRISTHTPLAGRDWYISAPLYAVANFYSHAPCGT